MVVKYHHYHRKHNNFCNNVIQFVYTSIINIQNRSDDIILDWTTILLYHYYQWDHLIQHALLSLSLSLSSLKLLSSSFNLSLSSYISSISTTIKSLLLFTTPFTLSVSTTATTTNNSKTKSKKKIETTLSSLLSHAITIRDSILCYNYNMNYYKTTTTTMIRNCPKGDLKNTTIVKAIPQSTLYDLCLEMKWDQVLSYYDNNNNHDNYIDAYYQDADNLETSLYIACQNIPPLNVIQHLIKWNHSGLYTRSRIYGDIPIHVACQYNTSYEIMQYLLQSYISTICQPNKWGNTPIQLLWNHHIKKQNKLLLNNNNNYNNQSQSQQNQNHQNLINITHHNIVSSNNNSINNSNQRHFYNNNQIQHYDTSTILWKKMDLLLKVLAYYRYMKIEEEQQIHNIDDSHNNNHNLIFSLSSSNTTNTTTNSLSSYIEISYILHGLVSLGSILYPYEILQYIIMKYPNQVYIKDNQGRLPFHIVISHILGQYVAIVDESNNNNDVKMNHNNNNQYHWSSRCRKMISQYPNEGYTISLLLNIYPNAVMIQDPNEPKGRYPLHTALINRHGSSKCYYCYNNIKNCNSNTNGNINNNNKNQDDDDDDDNNNNHNDYYCNGCSSIITIMSYTPHIMLSYRDPIYHLYPYQLAACSGTEYYNNMKLLSTTSEKNSDCFHQNTGSITTTTTTTTTLMDLDTTYRLLRMDPSVLSYDYHSSY